MAKTKYNDKLVMKQVAKYSSMREAAIALDIPRSSLAGIVERSRQAASYVVGEDISKKKISKPKRGVKRFIFSSAQDGTEIDVPFFDNLEAYAEYMDAEIHIGGFSYNRGVLQKQQFVYDDTQYHDRVRTYLTNAQFNVAGKLLFCGEINTSPTATRPLSGFETYTKHMWGVFPHPRVALQSIATMKKDPSKVIMTTGCLTVPNYIQRKAGVKAQFHHVIGAVIVEVDSDGDVFARHLIAEDDGGFQDLTLRVDEGRVTDGHTIGSMTWGDIHEELLDKATCRGSFLNKDSILDTLQPTHQFFHDLMDFTARNYHNSRDAHQNFEKFISKKEEVELDFIRAGKFLVRTHRPFCQSFVVQSNHDNMLDRWLREADYKTDPINAVFFLECQTEKYRAIKHGLKDFCTLEWAVKTRNSSWKVLQEIIFGKEDASYVVYGVEHFIHGHFGANGARGHLNSFAKMGPKANVAHTHSAAIHEGIWQAGTASSLDLGYNKGLSSWNHAHIGTYKSHKRVMIIMQGEKWRAQPPRNNN